MHIPEEFSYAHLEGTLAGLPCHLQTNSSKGRFLVASRKLLQAEKVLESEAYLTTVLPSWKKRICRGCFTAHSSRLSIKCQCNQAWYCSEACRESHASLGTSGAQCPVPHSLVCPVLSHFGGCKCDADMESVLHMCLDVLALQHLDTEARLAGEQRRATLGHADFLLLQDHSDDFNEDDRRGWLKALVFLEGALHKAAWPGQVPAPKEVLQIVGRIAANNFGIYRTRGGKVASGRQGVAAEKASVAGQAQEQTSDAATDTPASEQPCSINLAKLPAWPLAQTPLAQAGPEQCQSTPEPQHASTAGHQHSTAGDTVEHTDVESQSTLAGRSCQQPCKDEDVCSGLSDSLRLSEVDAYHETGSAKTQAATTPHPVQPARNVTTAGNADSSASAGAGLGAELSCGRGCPDKAQQHSSAAVPEVFSSRVSDAPDQTASVGSAGRDMCNSADVESCDPMGSSAHDLRERATASEELIGRELYIRASLLNHSCRPNCVVARSTATAAVHALRDIEEGEELTISYIDLGLPPSARCDELRKNFFFECTCDRCTEERAEGATKCTYERSKIKGAQSCAPKRRGRKARVSR
ncbi:probable N-lysine methyltransferase SMYD2 at C-terminar half [Coccomyxa sp. Obi]|nr:probable N-lysine methyltransferase SMYD2 at C-terminar half [Coccomyxa sp. Obi]